MLLEVANSLVQMHIKTKRVSKGNVETYKTRLMAKGYT